MLRAVVQVALEPAPFPVGRARQPRPGVGKLAQRLRPRGVELDVLLREERGCASRLEKLRIFRELGVVDDRDSRMSGSIGAAG